MPPRKPSQAFTRRHGPSVSSSAQDSIQQAYDPIPQCTKRPDIAGRNYPSRRPAKTQGLGERPPSQDWDTFSHAHVLTVLCGVYRLLKSDGPIREVSMAAFSPIPPSVSVSASASTSSMSICSNASFSCCKISLADMCPTACVLVVVPADTPADTAGGGATVALGLRRGRGT